MSNAAETACALARQLSLVISHKISVMFRMSILMVLCAGLVFGQATKKSARKPAVKPDAVEAIKQADPLVKSIGVEGNKILNAESVLKVAEIKVGDKIDKAAFDAAQARLLATGYFETVAYRYKSADGLSFAATLEVSEVQPFLPVRIEALPETQAAIVAWLKANDPMFTGKMPGTQQVLERTVREIEQFLAARNHPERVVARVMSLAADKLEIQIQPKSGLAAVAEVSFVGNKAIANTQLANALADVAFGQPFTEAAFRQLLENQIRPRYEAKGYLNVKFTKLTPVQSIRLKGVDVKIGIEEGEAYKLGSLAVGGRFAGESVKLLKIAKAPLSMPVADFDAIGQISDRLKDEMKHRGYLQAEIKTLRKLDETKKSVDVTLAINEGPQYKFGKLTVLGLGLDGEAAIKKMWGVKPGDAFPNEYPNYFLEQVKAESLFDNLGDTKATPKRDDETLTVAVTLDFKTAPLKPAKPKFPGAIRN